MHGRSLTVLSAILVAMCFGCWEEGVAFEVGITDSLIVPESETQNGLAAAGADTLAREEEGPDNRFAELPSYRIDEILVTAAKLSITSEKMPASISVITRAEIETQTDKTVVKILEKKEGIDSGSYGSFGAVELLSLRGGRSGRTPTLLDGVVINNAQNGAPDFNAVPLSLLDRIEILRGPIGSLQGGNGVGGVVNFVTTRPKPGEKPVALIGISSGSFAYKKYIGTFARCLGRAGMLLGVEEGASDGVGAYSDYSGKNYFGKLNYGFGRGREISLLTLSHSGVLKTVREAEQKTETRRLQLAGSIPFGQDTRFELRAFRSSELTDYKDPYVITLSELRKYGALADFYTDGTAAGNLSLGGGLSRSELSCEDAALSWKPSTWEGYVFAGDQIVLSERLRGLVSLRADFHTSHEPQISPHCSLWSEGKNGMAWLSFGRGFNPPTLNDLFWPTQTSEWAGWTYVSTGTENLKPESSWMADVGSRISLLGGSLRARVACFASRTKDYIEWESVVSLADTTVTYAPSNTARVDVGGVEMALEVARNGERVAGVNATLQRVEDGQHELLPYMPESKINLWFLRSFELLPELVVTLNLDASYAGRQLEPMGSSRRPVFLLEEKLSASMAGFTAYVRMRNATDTHYPSRYLEVPSTDDTDARYYEMAGRNYELGVLWKLLD